MARETARTKADRLLLEGRLVLLDVRPGHVRGWARGEGAVHQLGADHGTWWCRCEAASHAKGEPNCSHVQAARRVVAIEDETP